MVSKRQRLAKKRYREEHPDQFPKPEPTPPKDPDKKKKKMSKFKRKKYACFVGIEGIVSRIALTRMMRQWTRSSAIIVGKPGIRLLSAPNLFKKFANCFICNERGHLSKDCPQNTRGIYPKGGCCKICGGVTHLAKDCPNKGYRGSVAAAGAAYVNEERPRGQVIKFASGDDLEDDFFTDDKHGGNKDGSESKVGSASNSKESCVKPKKKQGPSIVNFVD
ncbi:uncharacterized protein CFP56_031447 [Quercus suber]|uniref:CCHC-type domain-containing protein n=1 Tax=Quercus suber TaxID=58331 RepID=A0AAW0LVP1_QUESU